MENEKINLPNIDKPVNPMMDGENGNEMANLIEETDSEDHKGHFLLDKYTN
jgi:hypothetical protein